MVPAIWNYLVGYAAGTAIAVIGLYIAFVLPVFLRLRLGDRFEHGAWSLGRHYKWIDVVSLALGGVHRGPLQPAALQGRAALGAELLVVADELHGALVRRASASFFGGWWVVSARKWFKGPVRMGTEEELELEARPAFLLPADRRGLVVSLNV